jgi:uncharacterized repeat protein (TIGR01451 family)
LNDAGGGTVNGTPIAGASAPFANLTAYLVNGAGTILASAPISATGTYAFTDLAAGTYKVVLSNVSGTTGTEAAISTALPAGWVNTGENNGAAAGSDGTVDGKSAPIALTAGQNATNVNFGIEQPPTSGNAVLASTVVPAGTGTVAVPVGAFVGTLPAGATGTVATDATTVTAVVITAFPANIDTITINGTSYTSGTFPAGGVTVTTAQLAGMTVDPKDSVTGYTVTYVAVDAAGKTSTVGSVYQPLVLVDLSIAKSTVGSFVKTQQGLYQLVITNVGTTSTVGTFTVADALPTGLTYVAASAVATNMNCSASTASAISCVSNAGFVLAPNASTTVSFSVSVALSAGTACAGNPSESCITNTAVVSGGGDSVAANNSSTAVTTLISGPDLRLTKTVAGTTAWTVGNEGRYALVVSNIGPLNAPFVTGGGATPTIVVTDTLPTGLQFTTATGAGWACSAAGQVITCNTTQTIASLGGVAPTITVVVIPQASIVNSTVTNMANVQGGGEPLTNYDSTNPANNGTANANNNSSVAVYVQLGGGLSGRVCFDINRDDSCKSASDTGLAGMTVKLFNADGSPALLPNGQQRTATTDASGAYSFTGLPPGDYNVRFFNRQGNQVLANPRSEGEEGRNGANQANQIATTKVVAGGAITTNQNLPLDPSGVVYDSITRVAVPGATVELRYSAAPTTNPASLPSISPADQAAWIVGGTSSSTTSCLTAACNSPGDGFYQFWLQPGAPVGYYYLVVTPPAQYTAPSQILPVQPGAYTPPSTGPATNDLIQPQFMPPTGAQATTYYFGFNLNALTSANVLNNHIPLDPASLPKIVISKTVDRTVAELGDSVRYTIRIKRTDAMAGSLSTVVVNDYLPAGFRYIAGTSRLSKGSAAAAPIADPIRSTESSMLFNLMPSGGLAAGEELVLTYRVRLGVGSIEGTGINRARAQLSLATNCITTPQACSNEARATVKVTAGVFTREACIVGKVYSDCNNNHMQDGEELGIPGVRLYLEDGSSIITDVEGKYSMCGLKAVTHVLKLDPLTMPKGSILTTSSSRNVLDAGSLFLDLKAGDLMRADFVEGSCANPVIEQIKARRSQGEVRAVERERSSTQLSLDNKPADAPEQATDSANQSRRLIQDRAARP